MMWEFPAPHRGHDRGSQMTDSNSDKERSEKRGVLDTGRARKLLQIDEDADADADDEDESE